MLFITWTGIAGSSKATYTRACEWSDGVNARCIRKTVVGIAGTLISVDAERSVG